MSPPARCRSRSPVEAGSRRRAGWWWRRRSMTGRLAAYLDGGPERRTADLAHSPDSQPSTPRECAIVNRSAPNCGSACFSGAVRPALGDLCERTEARSVHALTQHTQTWKTRQNWSSALAVLCACSLCAGRAGPGIQRYQGRRRPCWRQRLSEAQKRETDLSAIWAVVDVVRHSPLVARRGDRVAG